MDRAVRVAGGSPAAMTDDPATKEWHLDKRVPLALIVTIVLQTIVFGYWAGQTSNSVATLQDQVRVLSSYQERLTRVETRVDSANDMLARIDARLERMEDRSR